MNETLVVFGRGLCGPCAQNELSQHPKESLPADAVARQYDPTVCLNCGSDEGNVELPTVAGVPVCTACEGFLRHRPFPGWLKLSAVAMIALIVSSFIHNARFYKACFALRQAKQAMRSGDVSAAYARMDTAAKMVPETKEFRETAAFFHGLQLLKEEKAAEALSVFQACREYMQSAPKLQDILANAEIGAAFERKDYDTFLQKQQAMLQRYPNDCTELAGMASAYACKYAVTGQEEFKEQALHFLDEASKVKADQEAQFKDYSERILYRLSSREIISRTEYKRRFPNGWQAEAQK